MTFQEEFAEYIKANRPEAKMVSGGKEILVKCPFCGDGAHHNHLYISLGYDNKPIMMNCFKCGEGGFLTASAMRDLGLVDYTMIEKVVKFNRSGNDNGNPIRKMSTFDGVFYVNNNFIRKCPQSFIKRDYVNKRLGLNLSFSEMLVNKIVLNIRDLLDTNGIHYDPYDNFINELDKHFVGFLSEDNNFVIERNVDSQLDLRYFKYNVHGKLNKAMRYYVLPCTIDYRDPRPVNVHIAEGPFDILSVKYNIVCNNNEQNIFIAMGGKAYRNVIKHVITQFGLIYGVRLHIYADLDVSDVDLLRSLQIFEPFNFPIFLHRNISKYVNEFNQEIQEKDYGVPKEHIIDSVKQLILR